MTYQDDDKTSQKKTRRDKLFNKKSKKTFVRDKSEVKQKEKTYKTRKRQLEDNDSMDDWETWKETL